MELWKKVWGTSLLPQVALILIKPFSSSISIFYRVDIIYWIHFSGYNNCFAWKLEENASSDKKKYLEAQQTQLLEHSWKNLPVEILQLFKMDWLKYYL